MSIGKLECLELLADLVAETAGNDDARTSDPAPAGFCAPSADLKQTCCSLTDLQRSQSSFLDVLKQNLLENDDADLARMVGHIERFVTNNRSELSRETGRGRANSEFVYPIV